MVRKVSDMVLLLGSRGRSRTSSKSGFDQLLGRITRWFTGSSQRERQRVRIPLGAIAVALLCFAAGYFVGDRFGGASEGTDKALKAQTPGAIGEIDTQALTKDFLIAVGYDHLAPASAKPKAKQMAEFLQAQGLKNARPYEVQMSTGPLWLAVVYYDGEADRVKTQNKLRALDPAAVADEYFAKTRADFGKDWPMPYSIR